ncbi:MAG TPA: desulfoferrodoxin family protein [Lachnospiraceae bacterium]|nr:desulfoferrodoxin family protein [Lachnospiraceae bacterium]
MKLKFYVCETCGKVILMLNDTAVPTICCGKNMKELVPGSVDAAVEKHVPVVNVDGNCVSVTVGEVIHPMVEAHYIEWIAIETKDGCQMKQLKPFDEPKAAFLLSEGDEFVAAYAYCNLHGLWKK